MLIIAISLNIKRIYRIERLVKKLLKKQKI